MMSTLVVVMMQGSGLAGQRRGLEEQLELGGNVGLKVASGCKRRLTYGAPPLGQHRHHSSQIRQNFYIYIERERGREVPQSPFVC